MSPWGWTAASMLDRCAAGCHPVRPKGEFRFTPNDGATQVSFFLNAELGGIRKLLMSKTVQKSMDDEMASLDKAKAIIEQA
jgi:hypothetical protein